MESLPLIDVFSEDVPHISASYNAAPDLPSSDTYVLMPEELAIVNVLLGRLKQLHCPEFPKI